MSNAQINSKHKKIPVRIWDLGLGHRGFSLIEVIIAMGLVLVTMLMFGVAVGTVPLTRIVRNQNVAYHLAAGQIEGLRHTSFASLPGSGSWTDPGLSLLPGAAASRTMADYSGSNQIKQATVTVSWIDRGTTRSVTLTTLIYNGGLNQ